MASRRPTPIPTRTVGRSPRLWRAPERRSSPAWVNEDGYPLHDRLGTGRETGRRVAKGPPPASLVWEVRGLARPEGEVDDAVVTVDEPPVALPPVPEVHSVEAGVIAAGQVEVRLGGGIGEAVVAAAAEAVHARAQVVGEDGLDLALELVRGRQAPVRA